MKRTLIFLFFVFGFFTLSHSQIEEKIKKENVVPGVIIQNGKEIAGYIKKIDNAYVDGEHYPAPWNFQQEIRFISKDDFEKIEKLKKKNYTDRKSVV